MKIRVTLDITDQMRRAIAAAHPDWPRTDGRATRQALLRWIDIHMADAEHVAEAWIEPARLTREEEADTRQAVDYLHAAGWDAERIVNWIMAQRALMTGARAQATGTVIPLRST